MNNEPTYSIEEFERESRYIENLTWDALAIEPGERALFCGYGPEGSAVKRALAVKANVTVIEHRDAIINEFSGLGAQLLRGSTSVIPARDNTYDISVAWHYLHEVDPFFHAQVVSELARVAKRVCIIEPAPPTDPLGKRIALLYSQAKRELGQFEYYQPLEYWKKLLHAVKAEISQSVFAFAKVPPREYLFHTIELLLDTMEVEEAPRAYMEELRSIASRPGALLLPPPQYVLVGAAAGELPQPHYTERERPKAPQPALSAAAPSPPPQRTFEAPPQPPEFPPPPPPEPVAAPTAESAPSPAPFAAPSQGAPPPPVPAAPQSPFGFPQPPAPAPPEQPFGAPPLGTPPPPFGQPDQGAPFGVPFAMPPAQLPEEPGSPFGLPPMPGRPAGWQWEPPEDSEDAP